MAKRPLGMAKRGGAKKAKKEITLDVDADGDDVAQLQALWAKSREDEDNQALVNGVIHECDRLVREAGAAGGAVEPLVYDIYTRALVAAARFEEDGQEYLQAAVERIDEGLEKHPEAPVLQLARARAVAGQAVAYLADLDVGSEVGEVPALKAAVDTVVAAYEAGAVDAAVFTRANFDTLLLVDELVAFAESFGGDEDEEAVEVGETHPLYGLVGAHEEWRRTQHQRMVEGSRDSELVRDASRSLGNAILRITEPLVEAYIDTLDDEGDSDGSAAAERAEADANLEQAVALLTAAEDPDLPETWVAVAEVYITLGNIREGEAQEEAYAAAEKRLVRANKATRGKYAEVLDGLRGE